MKKQIIVIVTGVVILTTGITLGFNYFGTGNEALTSINAEINVVEQQLLEHKGKWEDYQKQKEEINSMIAQKQLVEKEAADELRKQLDDLLNEKKKLGLN